MRRSTGKLNAQGHMQFSRAVPDISKAVPCHGGIRKRIGAGLNACPGEDTYAVAAAVTLALLCVSLFHSFCRCQTHLAMQSCNSGCSCASISQRIITNRASLHCNSIKLASITTL